MMKLPNLNNKISIKLIKKALEESDLPDSSRTITIFLNYNDKEKVKTVSCKESKTPILFSSQPKLLGFVHDVKNKRIRRMLYSNDLETVILGFCLFINSKL